MPPVVWGALFVMAGAIGVYARTAYPTITWWDSGPYSLAALTLGIPGPPGSLLLTILGWLVTRLPFGGSPAFALNVLAGVLAALTVTLIYLVALRLDRGPAGGAGVDPARSSVIAAPLARPLFYRPPAATAAGAALGALAFAFSRTFWEYATQFTPYVLTTFFTALIFWFMIRWREEARQHDGLRQLLILGILFGLDFSVHRTNLLLLPGLFVWILLFRPRAMLSPRAWLSGGAGMAAGLAFHLLIIPIAAHRPFLNFGDPSSLSRFYEYVSLQQMGGGWLVSFFPRKSPFWGQQVMDVVRAFGDTFGPTGVRPGALAAALPFLFGLAGLIILWFRNRRTAVAIVALLLVHAAITILYFNIPGSYFRSLHRHYLPVYVIFAACVSYGLAGAAGAAARGWRERKRLPAILAGLAILFVPAAQLGRNWREADRSRSYFTEDYAANSLAGLPENAILFSNGDNDTFPVWYMQAVHRIRPDVALVNLPLLNASWYVDQLVDRDPEFPLSLGTSERHALAFREWPDTTLTLPVDGPPSKYGLPDSVDLPAALTLHLPPTVSGKYAMVQDQILLDILVANRWRRPLCFAVTVSNQNLAWVKPYCRLDGLFWRVVPCADPPANEGILRDNLASRYRYRGYADSGVMLDEITRMMGVNYYPVFAVLAATQRGKGDTDGCTDTRQRIASLLPPDRLMAGKPDLRNVIDAMCPPDSGRARGDSPGRN